ncbi:MAG: MBOAT family O-acyltransferase [Bacteroidota bacterium]
MIFNSATFLLFFLLFFSGYWLIPAKWGLRARNLWILLGSYVFYGWWDWRFLSLIIISSATDFLVGQQLARSSFPRNRKAWVALSLVVNLGLLGFFKYFNFFVESLVQFMALFQIALSPSSLEIILPVGISFYTFQTLSYTLDVYRGKMEATRDPLAFFAYVSFFPQLVAGPIERAAHLLPQFQTGKSFSYEQAVSGLRLVLYGLFKKVVIADNTGWLADQIFNYAQPLNGATVWLGCIFFALQIYGDFSGYSDMAIGLSRMLGFNLRPNFQTPYFARSFRTFWQRWHISLSTWFRDYLYIPLGGNRKGPGHTYLNLLITFLISGLWHGAHINFLLWGGLHGLCLILERRFRLERFKRIYGVLVLLTVILLWLPFRAESWGDLQAYAGALVEWEGYALDQFAYILRFLPTIRFWVFFGVLLGFLALEFSLQKADFDQWITPKKQAWRWGLYYLLVLAMLLVGNFSVNPTFIYFQF